MTGNANNGPDYSHSIGDVIYDCYLSGVRVFELYPSGGRKHCHVDGNSNGGHLKFNRLATV
ncbi:hypothetical protein D3C84_403760 [compost metagenome]